MNKILYAFLAIAVIYFVYSTFFKSPQAVVGEMAKDFEAELIDGTPFSIEDLKGQYVLLDFWGSWCGPCRRENPVLVNLYEGFHGKEFVDAEGFEVVTVALEKNDRMWKKAAQKDGFVWKNQIVQISKFVLASPIAQKYNVSNLPSKFLIGPKGNIISANMSYEHINRVLAGKLKS